MTISVREVLRRWAARGTPQHPAAEDILRGGDTIRLPLGDAGETLLVSTQDVVVEIPQRYRLSDDQVHRMLVHYRHGSPADTPAEPLGRQRKRTPIVITGEQAGAVADALAARARITRQYDNADM